MWKKAVVDRIVDGQRAVLLVGDEETEQIVPLSELPDDTLPGDWLQVQFEGRTLLGAAYDSDETEKARQRVRSKMKQLRNRKRAGS